MKIIKLEENEKVEDLAIEFEVMRKCVHPNIVRYLDGWFINNSILIIAMELCDGGATSDIYADLGGRPFTEAELRVVCRDALLGLEYMLAVGYLHRDIKGANVLLKRDGSVKLIDFGVCGRVTPDRPTRRSFVGTPNWMAPEVVATKDGYKYSPYDFRADVWSLGATLLELANAAPPYGECEQFSMSVLNDIVSGPPPGLDRPDAWSPEFRDFLGHCLQKDPRQRWGYPQLLAHQWLQRVPSGPTAYAVLASLVEKYLVAKKALDEAEDGEGVEVDVEGGSECSESYEYEENTTPTNATPSPSPSPPTPTLVAGSARSEKDDEPPPPPPPPPSDQSPVSDTLQPPPPPQLQVNSSSNSPPLPPEPLSSSSSSSSSSPSPSPPPPPADDNAPPPPPPLDINDDTNAISASTKSLNREIRHTDNITTRDDAKVPPPPTAKRPVGTPSTMTKVNPPTATPPPPPPPAAAVRARGVGKASMTAVGMRRKASPSPTTAATTAPNAATTSSESVPRPAAGSRGCPRGAPGPVSPGSVPRRGTAPPPPRGGASLSHPTSPSPAGMFAVKRSPTSPSPSSPARPSVVKRSPTSTSPSPSSPIQKAAPTGVVAQPGVRRPLTSQPPAAVKRSMSSLSPSPAPSMAGSAVKKTPTSPSLPGARMPQKQQQQQQQPQQLRGPPATMGAQKCQPKGVPTPGTRPKPKVQITEHGVRAIPSAIRPQAGVKRVPIGQRTNVFGKAGNFHGKISVGGINSKNRSNISSSNNSNSSVGSGGMFGGDDLGNRMMMRRRLTEIKELAAKNQKELETLLCEQKAKLSDLEQQLTKDIQKAICAQRLDAVEAATAVVPLAVLKPVPFWGKQMQQHQRTTTLGFRFGTGEDALFTAAASHIQTEMAVQEREINTRVFRQNAELDALMHTHFDRLAAFVRASKEATTTVSTSNVKPSPFHGKKSASFGSMELAGIVRRLRLDNLRKYQCEERDQLRAKHEMQLRHLQAKFALEEAYGACSGNIDNDRSALERAYEEERCELETRHQRELERAGAESPTQVRLDVLLGQQAAVYGRWMQDKAARMALCDVCQKEEIACLKRHERDQVNRLAAFQKQQLAAVPAVEEGKLRRLQRVDLGKIGTFYSGRIGALTLAYRVYVEQLEGSFDEAFKRIYCAQQKALNEVRPAAVELGLNVPQYSVFYDTWSTAADDDADEPPPPPPEEDEEDEDYETLPPPPPVDDEDDDMLPPPPPPPPPQSNYESSSSSSDDGGNDPPPPPPPPLTSSSSFIKFSGKLSTSKNDDDNDNLPLPPPPPPSGEDDEDEGDDTLPPPPPPPPPSGNIEDSTSEENDGDEPPPPPMSPSLSSSFSDEPPPPPPDDD